MKRWMAMAALAAFLFSPGCTNANRQQASDAATALPTVPIPGQAPSRTPAAEVEGGAGNGVSNVAPTEGEVEGAVAAKRMMDETGVEFEAPKGFENKNSINGNLSFKAKDAQTFVVVSVYDEHDPDLMNRKAVADLTRTKAPLKTVMEPTHEDRNGLSINTFEMATPNNNYQHLQVAVSGSSGNKVLVIWAHGDLNNAENKKAVDEMIQGIKKR